MPTLGSLTLSTFKRWLARLCTDEAPPRPYNGPLLRGGDGLTFIPVGGPQAHAHSTRYISAGRADPKAIFRLKMLLDFNMLAKLVALQ